MMPKIHTLRLGPIWLAFTIDDFGTTGKPRLGISRQQATGRVLARLP